MSLRSGMLKNLTFLRIKYTIYGCHLLSSMLRSSLENVCREFTGEMEREMEKSMLMSTIIHVNC